MREASKLFNSEHTNDLFKRTQERNFSQRYLEYRPSAVYDSNSTNIWAVPCDVALPCATQNDLSLEGDKSFINLGILSAFGIAVSGLEMSQNAMHYPWTYAEGDQKLEIIMTDIFKKAYTEARKYTGHRNVVVESNIAGFMRVYQTILDQGIL